MSQPFFLYAALCGLLYLALSAWVVQGRVAFKVGIGDGNNEAMKRRIRVHANFAEYVPLLLILLYAVQQAGFSLWIVHALGIILVAARLLHAAGLGKTAGVSRGRFIGASATFALLIVASTLVLLGAFGVRF